MIFVIERLIKKIAKSQAFLPEDKLGRMVKEYDADELAMENLDLVYAARKDGSDYAAFLTSVQERDNKGK